MVSPEQTVKREDPMDKSAAPPKRNPNWSRDELILAFDLYLKFRKSLPAHDSPVIQELSTHLNLLGKSLGQGDTDTYRNTNGVYMKLMNFRRFDPEYLAEGGSPGGLTRGNKEEGVIWSEFIGDPERLALVASAIRTSTQATVPGSGAEESGDEGLEVDAEEGRLLTRLHKTRERNRSIVRRKKQDALDQFGRLQCVVCGFDFEDAYGLRGRGFIECHHTRPLHTLAANERTKLVDLALLCSNCHRMIHAARPWMTVDQVRDIRSAKAH